MRVRGVFFTKDSGSKQPGSFYSSAAGVGIAHCNSKTQHRTIQKVLPSLYSQNMYWVINIKGKETLVGGGSVVNRSW